jgi:phospholipase/lecithinase/hemolysin
MDRNRGDCKWEERDSYMWWDELHPSEQTGRLLASEINNKLEGRSSY